MARYRKYSLEECGLGCTVARYVYVAGRLLQYCFGGERLDLGAVSAAAAKLLTVECSAHTTAWAKAVAVCAVPTALLAFGRAHRRTVGGGRPHARRVGERLAAQSAEALGPGRCLGQLGPSVSCRPATTKGSARATHSKLRSARGVSVGRTSGPRTRPRRSKVRSTRNLRSTDNFPRTRGHAGGAVRLSSGCGPR